MTTHTPTGTTRYSHWRWPSQRPIAPAIFYQRWPTKKLSPYPIDRNPCLDMGRPRLNVAIAIISQSHDKSHFCTFISRNTSLYFICAREIPSDA